MDEILKRWWENLLTVLNYPITLGNSELTLTNIFKLLVIVAILLLFERFVRNLLRRRVLSHTHLDPDLQYTLSRFGGYCFIGIGLFFALRVIHLDLSAFAVIIGALGVGIGFGLQNIVSNFVSGLVILAERPIAIGHRIEVGGVVGRVTQINLRASTVITNDNITIIVPNSQFTSQPVTNWSHGDPKVRLRIPVDVAYGSNVEKLCKVLLEVAAAYPAALKDPAPSVRFLEFGDSSLNFELAVWTIEMAHQPTKFRSDLYFAIESKLRENEIEIPFPQRDLHLRSGKITLETKTDGTTDVKLEPN